MIEKNSLEGAREYLRGWYCVVTIRGHDARNVSAIRAGNDFPLPGEGRESATARALQILDAAGEGAGPVAESARRSLCDAAWNRVVCAGPAAIAAWRATWAPPRA